MSSSIFSTLTILHSWDYPPLENCDDYTPTVDFELFFCRGFNHLYLWLIYKFYLDIIIFYFRNFELFWHLQSDQFSDFEIFRSINIVFTQIMRIFHTLYLLVASFDKTFSLVLIIASLDIGFLFNPRTNQYLELGQYSAMQLNLPIFIIWTQAWNFWVNIDRPKYSKQLIRL